MADDLASFWCSAPHNIKADARNHLGRLCDNFAKLFETGLPNGMADWPPNPW